MDVLLILPTDSSLKHCITILEHMLLPSLIMCLDGKLLSGIREIAVQHVASELNWMTLPYKGKAKKALTTSLSAGSKDMFVGNSAGYSWEICVLYNHLFKVLKIGEEERRNKRHGLMLSIVRMTILSLEIHQATMRAW